MIEKYFAIAPEKARELIEKTKEQQPVKHGIDSHVYVFDEYAVLAARNLKLRNIATPDDNLAYLDELIQTLLDLQAQGISVVPIFGYRVDKDDEDGTGYVLQPRAKGSEMYDDGDIYKTILPKTARIAAAPQAHFDKFISDIIVLFDNDILIDFFGKSNFFYDDDAGFQFIDLKAHTDYKYGLTDQKFDSKLLAAYYGFAPCHFAAGTKLLPHFALDEKAVAALGETAAAQLARDNAVIFGKCKAALVQNGVTQEQMNQAFEILKIYGID